MSQAPIVDHFLSQKNIFFVTRMRIPVKSAT
jgi:hypothetical protein